MERLLDGTPGSRAVAPRSSRALATAWRPAIAPRRAHVAGDDDPPRSSLPAENVGLLRGLDRVVEQPVPADLQRRLVTVALEGHALALATLGRLTPQRAGLDRLHGLATRAIATRRAYGHATIEHHVPLVDERRCRRGWRAGVRLPRRLGAAVELRHPDRRDAVGTRAARRGGHLAGDAGSAEKDDGRDGEPQRE
jgi:hypothetical protein